MSYIWDSSQYSATGLGMSMISNRLSWFYDLRGGSVTIDTACSSSLIAMHLGIQSLRTGEAKMVSVQLERKKHLLTSLQSIVGGANLILQPESMRGLSALRFLSPDGVCHSFDESANGYARGEGFGVLVLKPLKDALRDNDTIRAVIRGSYVNQDGKTPAITVPSSEAQADLINTAYKNAGLDLDGTQYFEAHGTGTAVGDPIELSGIGCSVGAGRTEANALYVGSVKTNLGHLESTAGMGGVIKTVLAMEHGMIPSVVGLENVNPRIQLEEWGIKLNTDLVPWPQCDVRRASVNSFGYGGANAHVILDDAKHYMEQRGLVGNHVTVEHHESISSVSSDSGVSVGTPTSETGGFSTMQKAPFRSPKLLVLSSPEQGGTARLAETYATYLDLRQQQLQAQMEESDDFMSIDSDYLENLAYTLGERRSAFDWRTFAVAGSVEEFQATAQRGLPNLRRTARNPAYACVFTGQGSQYFNMGRELQSNAVFLKSVMLADKYLASLGCPWSVMEEMNKSEESSKINQPELSQPICTILQVAIVDLLKHWGTSPSAVVGHSSGEIGKCPLKLSWL
jgi:acyl transferase domain-containing protein